MENRNPRFAEVAWIADAGQFRLRNWIEREQITLDASTTGGIHRRYSFFDALRIAIVSRLTKYGMDVQIANGMTSALFNSTPVGGYLIEYRNKKTEPPDTEKFIDALKNEVWALSRKYDERGETWQRTRVPESVRNLETLGDSFVVVDICAIAKDVTKRWETITSQKETI